MFGNLEMDMIALESAIDRYESENDLDGTYLYNSVSYDEMSGAAVEGATESAVETDDIFGALFSDMPATEAANDTADGEKKSFGAKLGQGIKNIAGAIGKFFRGLWERIKGVGKKIDETAAKAQAAKLPEGYEGILAASKDVRTAMQSMVGILDNTLKSDLEKIKKLCEKIDKAINKGKEKQPTTITQKEYDEAAAAMGKSFRGKKDDTEAFAEVDEGEKLVETIEAAEENLKKAAALIAEKFARVKEHRSQFEKSQNARANRGFDESEKDYNKRREDEAKADKDAYDTDSAEVREAKRQAGDGASVRQISDQIIKNVIMADMYMTGKNIVNDIKKLCDTIATACGKNEDYCKTLAKEADGVADDNTNAKIGYRLCKLYARASKSVSTIATYVGALSNGTVLGGHTNGTERYQTGTTSFENIKPSLKDPKKSK